MDELKVNLRVNHGIRSSSTKQFNYNKFSAKNVQHPIKVAPILLTNFSEHPNIENISSPLKTTRNRVSNPFAQKTLGYEPSFPRANKPEVDEEPETDLPNDTNISVD